jgi:NSS family neurotransmitter:Na+ symporter
MQEQQSWATRSGFILAAVGSAIGLGNIWRFPYIAYENGGGAFLIPYFFALITAGIPILILEFYLGHKLRGSAPLSFSKLGRFEWLGWWQVIISFVISTYYAVIIAWALAYTYFAVFQSWGSDTGGFLFGSYLGLTDANNWADNFFGGVQWKVFLPLVVVWLVAYVVLIRGVKRGIEQANKIFMPILFLLVIIMAIRGVTLDGAAEGLNALFTPNWDGIFQAGTWIDAYTQIFFSLSIAFAIMITYSSYLPKKSDINNNAFITAFANCGFSLIAGIAVFSAIGFMAKAQGVGVDEVAAGGVGLAFVVFPQILNEMPWGEFVGVLFFLSLVFAGISSLISIVETFVAAIGDKFNVSRTKAVNWSVGVAALVSILYATGSGLYLLDSTDRTILTISVGLTGLLEIVIIGWILNRTNKIRAYNNAISDFKIGPWWNFFLIVITPAVLGYSSIKVINGDLTNNYEGYPNSIIAVSWGIAVLAFVLSFFFQSLENKNPEFNNIEEEETA